MSLRRDWLLQQMGITHYILRRPRVLQGEIAISLPAGIRLVIVADDPPALSEPLVSDVLRALRMSEQQVFTITPRQAVMLPAPCQCPCWCLTTVVPALFSGVQLCTPSLNELYQDASAKRALWQQICNHEVDLFTDSR